MSIRAVTFEMTGSTAILRYHLDRQPNDFDYDSVDMVATNLDSGSQAPKWEKIEVECSMHTERLSNLRPEEIVVYARREYDMA